MGLGYPRARGLSLYSSGLGVFFFYFRLFYMGGGDERYLATEMLEVYQNGYEAWYVSRLDDKTRNRRHNWIP